MEFFREAAADQYRALMRKPWMLLTGSRTNQKSMTAALIDSRDFLDSRLRQKAAALTPAGQDILRRHRELEETVREAARRSGEGSLALARSLCGRR